MVRSITVLVVLAMAVGLVAAPSQRPAVAADRACPDASPAPFVDRDEIAEVHVAAVDCLWELGIVQGRMNAVGERRFLPRHDVPRDQFVGLLHATIRALGHMPSPMQPSPRFVDVPRGHTFATEIDELAGAGVISGTSTHHFSPDRTLRRDETAALLVRSLRWITEQPLLPTAGPHFEDTSDTVHQDAIATAFEYGLVEGLRRPCATSPGIYAPTGPMPREQVATALLGLFGATDEIDRDVGGRYRGDDVCPAPRWMPDLDAANGFADDRHGRVSFAAIGTDGALVGRQPGTRVSAASVLKVMFLVAFLRQPDVRDRELTLEERSLLEPMIRRSANEPATRIADRLGPEPIEDLAVEAGMRDFAYTRPWGLSRTSARDQAAFMLEVDAYVPARHRAYVLALLGDIVAAQRWGIGQLDTGAWTTHFKGGWGAGTGLVDHQVALLRHEDGTRVSVAVMTTDNLDHDDGKATLHGVFTRLLDDLP